MLTEIPVRDWENCDAVPSTLSALIGVVVPGQLRKVEAVFVVSDLKILGISSVKSETDEWLITCCVRCKRDSPCAQHPDGSTEKRLAVRLTLADGNSQCSVMLFHELVLKAAVLMEVTLPELLADSKELRTTLRDMFRNAQWICRFTFKERSPAILGIGVSRHSSLPAASAGCRADDSTGRPVESASLPLEQWLPSGAVE